MKPIFVRVTAFGVMAATLVGCGGWQEFIERKDLLIYGPDSKSAYNESNIKNYTEANRRLYEVINEANSTMDASLASDDAARKRTILVVGYGYVDNLCSNYLFALYRFRRDTTAIGSGINIIGGTASGVLAAVHAAALPITLVALGQSALLGVNDAITNNIVFNVDPGEVERYVLAAQKLERLQTENLMAITPRTMPEIIQYVRDYAKWCTPQRIEYLIKDAIRSNQPKTAAATPEIILKLVSERIGSDLNIKGLPILTEEQLSSIVWLAGLNPRPGDEVTAAMKGLPASLIAAMVDSSKTNTVKPDAVMALSASLNLIASSAPAITLRAIDRKKLHDNPPPKPAPSASDAPSDADKKKPGGTSGPPPVTTNAPAQLNGVKPGITTGPVQ